MNRHAPTQVLEQLLLANTVAKIRNVVFMGMGEPLNNYNAVISALRQMTDRRVFSLRAGHITVSTVGVVPSMHKLTRDMPSVSLALSLHASNQHVREVIVPTATAYPFEQIMGALDNHLSNCNKKSNTSVAAMIEYILIANINDADEHAVELGTLMRDRNVMINIIPYNYTPGNDFQAPSQEKCDAFQRIVVEHSGRMCRVRRVHGSDIAGACGQLALSMPKKAAAGGPGGGCSDGSGAGDCGGGGDGAHRPGVVDGTAAAPVDIEDILGGDSGGGGGVDAKRRERLLKKRGRKAGAVASAGASVGAAASGSAGAGSGAGEDGEAASYTVTASRASKGEAGAEAESGTGAGAKGGAKGGAARKCLW